MSGGNISYNIRPNKYVERQLFVELLSKIIAGKNPDSYVYVSMGGPQLEDHKLVHQVLGFRNLISIEENQIVYERQKFNLRPSYVDCRKEATGDFVVNFDVFASNLQDKILILWFDYASANERLQQITEYRTLLGKLQPNDVLKITLNANPGTLGKKLKENKKPIFYNVDSMFSKTN